MLLFLNFQAWMHDYAPPPQARDASAGGAGAPGAGDARRASLGNRVPQGAQPAPLPPQRAASRPRRAAAVPPAATAAATPRPMVHVRTDVLDLDDQHARRHARRASTCWRIRR